MLIAHRRFDGTVPKAVHQLWGRGARLCRECAGEVTEIVETHRLHASGSPGVAHTVAWHRPETASSGNSRSLRYSAPATSPRAPLDSAATHDGPSVMADAGG